MTTTDEILQAARQLGKLIADHPAAKKFQECVHTLQGDVETQRLLTDYNRHLQKLAQKEAQGQPIEVDEKRQLDQLQGQVARHPRLRDLQTTQMDYLDLMRQVDQALTGDADLAPAFPEPTLEDAGF